MATLLLIEDVAAVRTTLKKFLERGGHTVTACDGGHEAWRVLGHHRFDAIVTDIWMKDGDGLDLIGRMRAKGDTTPVVVITGGDPRSPQSISIEVAIRAGADHALMKPVTKTVLLDTVAACLEAREQKQ